MTTYKAIRRLSKNSIGNAHSKEKNALKGEYIQKEESGYLEEIFLFIQDRYIMGNLLI